MNGGEFFKKTYMTMDTSRIINIILLVAVVVLLMKIFVFDRRDGKQGAEKTAAVQIDSIAAGELKKIDAKQLDSNVFTLFDDGWFVLTAGDGEAFNPMTISWGGMGILWNEPVVTVYVRHDRHTYSYINENKSFTICAFGEKYRDAMQYIGTHSGRDGDKVEATGLTAKRTELGNVYYDEASLVIECEKIYSDDIEPRMIFTEENRHFYDDKPMHRMFIGKILNVWVRE